MRKIIFLCFLGFSLPFFSQNTLEGKIVDELNAPLENVTIVLLEPEDGSLKYYGMSNYKGLYQIKAIKNGIYKLQISYVGMEAVNQNITFSDDKLKTLPDVIMKTSSLDEIILKIETMPLKFKSDTLEYNTKFFKTRNGARVEELLSSLPGIKVDRNGNIKANGEDVTNILVDGKKFFGNDPKVATKNLPAEALKKVQIFDKKSEEAEFTGIEDGVRNKTINLLLKEEFKSGYFGNAETGLGTNKTYKVDGKLFRFSTKVQTALLLLGNNINDFGYTNRANNTFGEDVKGNNKSLAGGLNLSYSKSDNNRYFMSYLGNQVKKDLNQNNTTENFLNQGVYSQFQDLIEDKKESDHNFNFGVRQDFNRRNRLIIDSDLSMGNTDLNSESIINSELNSTPVNRFNNTAFDDQKEIDFNIRSSFVSKFKNNKTQFRIRSQYFYKRNKSDLNFLNNSITFDPTSEVIETINRNDNVSTKQAIISPAFVYKLNKSWSFDFGNTFQTKKESLKRFEYNLEANSSIDNLFSTKQNNINPFLSIKKTVGNSFLDVSLNATIRTFDKVLNGISLDREKYAYFLPSLSYRNNYRSGRKIEARYFTSLKMPSADQLFPILNTINPASVYVGNLDLAPEIRHTFSTQWSVFDQFSFTSFTARLMGNYTKNYTSFLQTVDDNFVRTIKPINTSNQKNISLFLDYSRPIPRLGLEMSISLDESLGRTIGFINDQENINTNLNHNFGVSFQNRNRDKWRLDFGGVYSINRINFSISEIQDNILNNMNYNLNLGFTPNKKWNFELNSNVFIFDSQIADSKTVVPLIKAEVSYYFMEAERASISLSGFDLLGKNKGFQQTSIDNYISRTQWNTLQQYFMLKFKWRIGR